MIGRGTDDDPRRPMFAPVIERRSRVAPERSGIIGYTFQESDDGQFALVEFVALDRSALEPILAVGGPAIRVFEKGRTTKADIENEFRQFKRNFDIERFRVNIP